MYAQVSVNPYLPHLRPLVGINKELNYVLLSLPAIYVLWSNKKKLPFIGGLDFQNMKRYIPEYLINFIKVYNVWGMNWLKLNYAPV